MKYSGVYMVETHKPTQESDLTLSSDECRAYLKAVCDLKFQQLDTLLETVHSVVWNFQLFRKSEVGQARNHKRRDPETNNFFLFSVFVFDFYTYTYNDFNRQVSL